MTPLHLRDNTREDSLAHRLRQRRFRHFLALIAGLPSPVRILDVGGTVSFWERAGVEVGRGVDVVVLNVEVDPHASEIPGIRQVAGDARDLSAWGRGAFEVVFSNSVIEHVGRWRDQQRMADEVRRVGCSYFVQTPNYWFPVEPHFVFPGFQYLPVSTRVTLLQRFPIAWSGRIRDPARARAAVEGVRLLTRRQMHALFPDAEIRTERFAGLAKSYMAIRRFGDRGQATRSGS